MGDQLVIEHYTAHRIPNPYPGGELPWQVYHAVRNAVLRCCRRFGKAGPMGERPITEDEEISDKHWPLADHPQDFYVVDDQLNHERYIYVEIETPSVFTEAWLRDLMRTLAEFPGWGVGIIAFKRAYILAFADKLMVTGEIFEACHDIACVVSQAQHECEGAKSQRDPHITSTHSWDARNEITSRADGGACVPKCKVCA